MLTQGFRLILANLPLLVAITLGYGLIYAAIQQSYRQGANDPQIQIARDLSNKLDQGAVPTQLVSSDKVDIRDSLAPFVIIYDTFGNVEASSGVIGGATPVAPPGILSQARSQGEHRVTWETKEGVRIAAVIVRAASHTVLAGRNLREVELREQNFFNQVLLAGVVTVAAILISAAFLPRIKSLS